MRLTNEIDCRAGLTREQFEQEYLLPLRPVVLTDAINHWRALGDGARRSSRRTTAT